MKHYRSVAYYDRRIAAALIVLAFAAGVALGIGQWFIALFIGLMVTGYFVRWTASMARDEY